MDLHQGTHEAHSVLSVDIGGQKISVRSSSSPDQAAVAVRLAQKLIQDAEARSKNAHPFQIAVIALLDLAESYVDSKQRVEEHQKRIAEKSDRLLELISCEAG